MTPTDTPLVIGKVGAEFLVNAVTSGDQFDPDVAALGGSSFVVVWSSREGYSTEIKGQLFDAVDKVGSEFGISDNGDYQADPRVSADSTGRFVVVWEDSCFKCPADVYGRQFAADGTPLASEFVVANSSYSPDVAVAPAGAFVVVWSDFGYGIYGRRYDSSADPVGSQFLVSNGGESFAYAPAVAIAGDGAFAVVWSGDGVDSSEIFGRLYDSGGGSVGSEFMINTYTTGFQFGPDVAMESSGAFVVAWASYGQDDPEGYGAGIYAQRFDALGGMVGTEFLVNTYTTANQTGARVAIEDDGDFVITWESGYSNDATSGGAGNGAGPRAVTNGGPPITFWIAGQRFSGDGSLAGSEFIVNSDTSGYPQGPAVAALGATDFVIVWEGPDGDYSGVYGQRFGPVTP